MEHVNINAFDDLVKVTYKSAEIFLVHDFFKPDALEKIKTKLFELSHEDGLWDKVPLQEDNQRKYISAQRVELFKKINDELNSAEFIEKINTTLGWEVTSGSFNVWHDTEGYNISLHVDNDKVKYAIQIYLLGVDNHLGTSFAKKPNKGEKDIFITIPYKENFGYCMKNVNDVEHGLITAVPKNFDRYSIYFLYN